MKTIFLTAQDVLAIHKELVDFFAKDGDPISPSGVKDENLFHSAIYRPQTSLDGIEKYATLDRKAAALLHSLIKNHAFYNGNKRTALVSLLSFLDRNGIRIEATDDELFNFVLSVANNNLGGENQDSDESVDSINDWLRGHSDKISRASVSMSVKDFLKSIEKAGGHYKKKSNGNWAVWGLGKASVNISGSTRDINGNVVKRCLIKLGLSEGQTGFYVDEFRDDITNDQKFIRQFRDVLTRLADA